MKHFKAEEPNLKLLKAKQCQGMARARASLALLLHKIHEIKAPGAEDELKLSRLRQLVLTAAAKMEMVTMALRLNLIQKAK